MQALPVTPTTPSFEPNDVVGSIDYSQPISVLVRSSTLRAHEAVESSSSAVKLLKGELSKEEYTYFTMMLWRVYSALENGLEKHSTHPVLAPTHRPALLSRAGRLSADIAYLMNTTEEGWRSSPLYLSLVSTPPPGLRNYVAHLEKLSASDDSLDHSRLLAHAYVRYLGDLSGGQSIRNKMIKAYGLPVAGAGVSFFDFGSLDGTSGLDEKRATQAELFKVKEWYRAGMNEGVGDDVMVKAAIISEANLAFDLNARLFQDVSAAAEATDNSDYASQTKVVFDGSQEQQEKTYPVASVVAVVMALALAHFILVVGGFTGARGTEKLEGVMLWLRGASDQQ